MTRAERRRAHAQWVRDMKALHQDGGSVFSIEILYPHSHPTLLGARAIVNWGRAVESGALDRPLCLDCDVEFGGDIVPHAFMLLVPARSDPSITSITPICSACATQTEAELYEIAIRRIRRMWPGARRLPQEHMHAHAGWA
jgi:hypothetical protein